MEKELNTTAETTEEVVTVEDNTENTAHITEQQTDNEEVSREEPEDKNFHPDVTSNEDRKKIMEGYKKSLRNRIFAPLVGGGASINPIDIINEENEEEESFSLDFYDIVDQRLTAMEKKAESALVMARVSTAIGILAAGLAILSATLK